MSKKKKKTLTSDEIKDLVIEGMRQKKGRDIVSIDFKNMTNAIADYFVICHGSSSTQVETLADNVYTYLRKKGNKPWHTEGKSNAEWILIDYVDVVVHIFIDTSREFYQIEKLWGDAEIVSHDSDI